MSSKFVFCLWALLAVSTLTVGQSDCWVVREDWQQPTFDATQLRLESYGLFEGNNYHEVRFKKQSQNRGRPEDWNVFTDRANVQVREKPKPDAPLVSGQQNHPMGTQFFVADEEGDYFLLKEAGYESCKDRKDIGWVLKQELLLWRRPLQSMGTGIDIKAFIVNTDDYARAIQQDADFVATKDIYKIFDAPAATEPTETNPLYSVLFVYKYDDIHQRFLVSDKYKLKGDGDLLGWVSKDRVQLWETTLALEPNFDGPAIRERAVDEDRWARVYETSTHAKAYMKGSMGSPIMKRDVHKQDEDAAILEVEENGSTRFNGEIPRWPLYEIQDDVYRCGVIGRISLGSDPSQLEGATDERLARAKKKFQGRQQSIGKTNVVFVVETTEESQEYVDVLESIQEDIYGDIETQNRKDVKWGFVGYSDTNCGDGLAISVLVPVTNKAEDFLGAVEQNFQALEDGPQDDVATVNMALYKALSECRMNPNETNIMIHLGQHHDISQDFDREFDLDECPELSVRDRILYDKMNELTLHYIAMQMNPNPGQDFFVGDAMRLMENAAQAMHNEVAEKDFFEDSGVRQQAPTMSDRDDRKGESVVSSSAVTIMRILWPGQGTESLTSSRFRQEAVDAIRDAMEKSRSELEGIEALYSDNSTIAGLASDYPEITRMLASSGLDEETIRLLMKERVQLYYNGVAPKECHGCVQGEMYKLCMFLSEEDVQDIQDRFDELAMTMSADIVTRKEKIREFWVAIAEGLLNMKKTDEIKVDDIRKSMTGLQGSGVPMGNGLLNELSLGDVEDLSEEQVIDYLEACAELAKFWEEINGSNYPYIYHPGGDKSINFYWIPFEKIF